MTLLTMLLLAKPSQARHSTVVLHGVAKRLGRHLTSGQTLHLNVTIFQGVNVVATCSQRQLTILAYSEPCIGNYQLVAGVDIAVVGQLPYSLNAVNHGTQNLTTLIVNDATPAFTSYQSAACPATLPAGITACTVTTQPAVGGQGGLQWTFAGSLAPGAELAVTYLVKVEQ